MRSVLEDCRDPAGACGGKGACQYIITYVATEDPFALIMKESFRNQVINQPTRFETWVELDERLRPQFPLFKFISDKIPDTVITDPNEAPDELAVIFDQVVPELKNIHGNLILPNAGLGNFN